MAIRVQTQADITFTTGAGLAGAETITGVRFRRASDDGQPVIIPLSPSLAFRAAEPMTIPSGMMDVLYVSGDLTDAHMLALVEGYWGTSGSRVAMEIDLLTANAGAGTVSDDTNYRQQSYSDWDITSEADPS